MKKGLLAVVMISIAIWGFVSWNSRVTHLNAPLLKIERGVVGKKMLISGIAYPNAKVALYVDGNFVQEAVVNYDGSFQEVVSFSKEGNNIIKAKQIYKTITSDFSDESNVLVDLTPPDKNSVKINTKIPTFSKESKISISGQANTNDKVLINGAAYKPKSDGSFTADFQLKNGDNELNISIADDAGNNVLVESHTIKVDSVPPKIGTTYCGSSSFKPSLLPSEEYVCVSTGQWESWEDPAPIPIEGYIVGDIGSITVNGKKITPDEKDEIFQRIYLPVPRGLNKYKVVVTDKYGNQNTANITMTVQSVNNNSSDYDDVIDRLDDIDGKLDDIEY